MATNSPLNLARHSHTATLCLNAKVLVAGGGGRIVSTRHTSGLPVYLQNPRQPRQNLLESYNPPLMAA